MFSVLFFFLQAATLSKTVKKLNDTTLYPLRVAGLYLLRGVHSRLLAVHLQYVLAAVFCDVLLDMGRCMVCIPSFCAI